jgi:hypothetical protein
MGSGALVGAVANRTAGGGPGIDPAAFGQFSERQAMSANAARGVGVGVAAAGSSGVRGGVAVAAIQTLHKTINAVASRMEQQAGHAGLEGANPTAYPAGYPMYGSVRRPRRPVSTRSDSSAGSSSNSGKA